MQRYTCNASTAMLAEHTSALALASFRPTIDVALGDLGSVIIDDANIRVLRSMRWGYRSRFVKAGESDRIGYLGMIDDILDRVGEGRALTRPCLVPFTTAAAAGGDDQPGTGGVQHVVACWAGFWTGGTAHDAAYIIVAVPPEPPSLVLGSNPVALHPSHYDLWMEGDPDHAVRLQYQSPATPDRLFGGW